MVIGMPVKVTAVAVKESLVAGAVTDSVIAGMTAKPSVPELFTMAHVFALLASKMPIAAFLLVVTLSTISCLP